MPNLQYDLPWPTHLIGILVLFKSTLKTKGLYASINMNFTEYLISQEYIFHFGKLSFYSGLQSFHKLTHYEYINFPNMISLQLAFNET